MRSEERRQGGFLSVLLTPHSSLLTAFADTPAGVHRHDQSGDEAGGVGLNIQAASVVILCEPQVKPSIEAQAIARAHRMGQVRTVQVHRLLIEDSVDQRMLELLGSKAQLFDAYVQDVAPKTVEVALSVLI